MKTNTLAVLAVASMLGVVNERSRGYSLERPRNMKLHHTKPWESTDDARKRKKKERQNKKKGRNGR